MTRRCWVLFAAALTACGPKQLPPDLFPETAGGVWRRTSLTPIATAQPPDPVPAASIKSGLAARYEGPGRIEARAYALASSGVALDLVQRWTPSADTVFFHRDHYFVIVRWQDAGRAQLQAFVNEIEKRLDPRSGTRGPL